MGEVEDTNTTDEKDVSALGGWFERTPMVVPTREHLDAIRKLMRGDLYIDHKGHSSGPNGCVSDELERLENGNGGTGE